MMSFCVAIFENGSLRCYAGSQITLDKGDGTLGTEAFSLFNVESCGHVTRELAGLLANPCQDLFLKTHLYPSLSLPLIHGAPSH